MWPVTTLPGSGSLAAKRRRMSRIDEESAFNDRYLVVQPNIDDSVWSLNGRLPGVTGSIVVQALEAKADTLPAGPGTVSRTARNVDALWAISLDALAGGDGATIDPSTPVSTMFVDATHATPTRGQAGETVEAGPRVGEAAIEATLYDGIIEVTTRTTTGIPLALGRRNRVIPPRLQRFILARDDAVCTVTGCTSRYRLHIHHTARWTDRGRTDPDNLTTLCWFHHHSVIHGQGFTIDPHSPPQRRRPLRPPIHNPPRLEHTQTRGMTITEKPDHLTGPVAEVFAQSLKSPPVESGIESADDGEGQTVPRPT